MRFGSLATGAAGRPARGGDCYRRVSTIKFASLLATARDYALVVLKTTPGTFETASRTACGDLYQHGSGEDEFRPELVDCLASGGSYQPVGGAGWGRHGHNVQRRWGTDSAGRRQRARPRRSNTGSPAPRGRPGAWLSLVPGSRSRGRGELRRSTATSCRRASSSTSRSRSPRRRANRRSAAQNAR
jgi:hypothetical protein